MQKLHLLLLSPVQKIKNLMRNNTAYNIAALHSPHKFTSLSSNCPGSASGWLKVQSGRGRLRVTKREKDQERLKSGGNDGRMVEKGEAGGEWRQSKSRLGEREAIEELGKMEALWQR